MSTVSDFECLTRKAVTGGHDLTFAGLRKTTISLRKDSEPLDWKSNQGLLNMRQQCQPQNH